MKKEKVNDIGATRWKKSYLLTLWNNMFLYILFVAGGANAFYPTEVTDRIRSSNAPGPGIRMQFKQPVTRNLNYEIPLENNVSRISIYYVVMWFWISTSLYLLSYMLCHQLQTHFWNVLLQLVSEAYTPSSSHALAGPSRRNAQKSVLPVETANPTHGNGNKVGPSTSWISSLQRISSGKWSVR